MASPEEVPFVLSDGCIAAMWSMAVVSSVVSIALVFRHLQILSRPDLQYPIMRMVLLVPVYAVSSQFDGAAVIVRDVYEAYAVYVFFVLMVDFAGGESAVVTAWQSKTTVNHIWPCSYVCRPIPLDAGFLRHCRRTVIQFVVTKTLSAIISLVILIAGEGESAVVEWILFTWYTLSYTAALYYLFLFYLGLKSQLTGLRPAAKFLVLKSAVFATYYIALVLQGLPDLPGGADRWDAFVTTVCMLLLAPAFWIAYGVEDFKVGGAASISIEHASACEAEGRDCRAIGARAWGLCDVAGLCVDACNQFDRQRSQYIMQGDTLEGQAERAARKKQLDTMRASSLGGRPVSGSTSGVGSLAVPLDAYNGSARDHAELGGGDADDGDLGAGGRDAWAAGSLGSGGEAPAPVGSDGGSWADSAGAALVGSRGSSAGWSDGRITEASSVKASKSGRASGSYGSAAHA
jgi:hypothetical protein